MLEIRQISKSYHGFQLKEINLDIRQGEYFVVTGPSGAGKSVLFEIIAGIIHADSGELFLKKSNITNSAVQKRKIGLVFQDNTLFPHLTVKQNIAYPLKVKKLNQSDISKRVAKLAEDMGIESILNRKPAKLSGGEIQRVSIARALAGKADCLLLDEPLSSLDVQSKDEIRLILKKIHQEGLTVLHITHDQREAFHLADRMAVMVNGEIIQCDQPLQICKAPKSKFVADFIGFRNFYPVLSVQDNKINIAKQLTITITQGIEKYNFLILPEHAITLNRCDENPPKENEFIGIIKEITFFPDSAELLIDIGLPVYKNLTYPNDFINELTIGLNVYISIDKNKIILL
jgi:ABC-type sugar transport system ATPase subunit